jgi:hypothetical protein
MHGALVMSTIRTHWLSILSGEIPSVGVRVVGSGRVALDGRPPSP